MFKKSFNFLSNSVETICRPIVRAKRNSINSIESKISALLSSNSLSKKKLWKIPFSNYGNYSFLISHDLHFRLFFTLFYFHIFFSSNYVCSFLAKSVVNLINGNSSQHSSNIFIKQTKYKKKTEIHHTTI